MNNTFKWYKTLKKPSWAPPNWLFGPVWTVLYIQIFISFGFVFYQVATGKLPLVLVLPFVLNLIFNFSFTPLQFGLKNNFLAAVDIILVLLSLLWLIWVIYPYAAWIAYLQIPYLLWVGFATILQLNVTYLNRKL